MKFYYSEFVELKILKCKKKKKKVVGDVFIDVNIYRWIIIYKVWMFVRDFCFNKVFWIGDVLIEVNICSYYNV